MGKRHFKPGLYQFLAELEANNEKPWWEQNKARYTTLVRDPSLEFISDFSSRLGGFSRHFVADPRPVGGSLMRPYRDLRFSPDKTPYKTNVGIHFRHKSAKDVHAPGVYVHLEPGSNFVGVGLWSPEPKLAHAIRRRINDEPDEWHEAVYSGALANRWSLSHPEEALKRLPKQYDPDHPHADDMRLKSFVAGRSLSQKAVTSAGFADDLAGELSCARPLAAFLCDAVGLPF